MTPLFCPQCVAPTESDSDALMRGAFLECSKCSFQFNLYDLYQSLYDTVPLATELANKTLENASSAFRLESGEQSLRELLQREVRRVADITEKIQLDLIIFGNSFWHYSGAGSTLSLSRINLPDFEIVVEPQRLRGTAYSLGISRLVQKKNGTSTFETQDLIHFSYKGIGGRIGLSIYGLWLHLWDMVKTAPEALINSSVIGKSKDIEAIKKYAREQVIMGSGVPFFLVTGDKVNNIQRKFLMEPFVYDGRSRRRTIGNTIEGEIFPLLANQEWEYRQFPEIIWEKDQPLNAV